jgi:hypothetical protein
MITDPGWFLDRRRLVQPALPPSTTVARRPSPRADAGISSKQQRLARDSTFDG